MLKSSVYKGLNGGFWVQWEPLKTVHLSSRTLDPGTLRIQKGPSRLLSRHLRGRSTTTRRLRSAVTCHRVRGSDARPEEVCVWVVGRGLGVGVRFLVSLTRFSVQESCFGDLPSWSGSKGPLGVGSSTYTCSQTILDV